MEHRKRSEARRTRALLLGIGNVLLSDDGIGVHVIRSLDASRELPAAGADVTVCDGGTLGLELLGQLSDIDALIVVDASEFEAEPGAVRAFLGADMDAQVGGRRRSVHEVALADLLGAAALTGRTPPRRALVGIQPSSTDWGLEPTDAVRAAIPQACMTVMRLLGEWQVPHDES